MIILFKSSRYWQFLFKITTNFATKQYNATKYPSKLIFIKTNNVHQNQQDSCYD